MPLTQWLLLVFLSLLWGGSFLFVGMAVHELPLLTLVSARVGLAAVVLLPVAFAMGLRLPSRLKAWQPFMVMAFLNNIIPFMLIVRGQKEIASGLASVLNATTPLFGVILAHFLADEKLTLQRLAGVLTWYRRRGGACRAGSAVRQLDQSDRHAPGARRRYFLRRFRHLGPALQGPPPLVTATSQLTCSTLVLLPLTLAIDQPWQLAMPSGPAIAAVIALAVLSTALAYIVFFRIMAVSGPTNTLLVTLLIPVSAIAFGTLFLDEVLLPRHIAGALVIGIALVILDGRVFALLETKTRAASQLRTRRSKVRKEDSPDGRRLRVPGAHQPAACLPEGNVSELPPFGPERRSAPAECPRRIPHWLRPEPSAQLREQHRAPPQAGPPSHWHGARW